MPSRLNKTSPLDVLACPETPVPGGGSLTYTVGGAEAGGGDAERVLSEVEIDESALNLTGQFSVCRRIVLLSGGRVISAAVFELHAAANVLEIPIFASSRMHRQRGHGSVLLALLTELAVRHLDARVLVVSATSESRRFWLSMGLHVSTHCPPPVASALRYLKQHGFVAMGFFASTTQMAKSLPPAVGEPGDLVQVALQRAASKTGTRPGLSAACVADALGYSDLPAGTPSYVISCDGARVPLGHGKAGECPIHLQPWRLQAFERPEDGCSDASLSSWGEPGWGVRCAVPLDKGQAVLEVTGEWLVEAQHEARIDRRFMLPLDQRAARRDGSSATYLDLRKAGSVARLVSVCMEAPNLELSLVTTGIPAPATSPPPRDAASTASTQMTAPPPLAAGVIETASSSEGVLSELSVVVGDGSTMVPAQVTTVAPKDVIAPLPDDGLGERLDVASAANAVACSAVGSRSAVNCLSARTPPMATAPPAATLAPVLIRAYLIARHDIPAMVELTWIGPGGTVPRPPAASLVAADDVAESDVARNGCTSRGVSCEVRQHEPGLRGAFFSARRLTGPRGDGLVRVQYSTLYESAISETALTEWLKPFDDDHVRPEPPAPPDGFLHSLRAGDDVDVWHEAGWWPVRVNGLVPNAIAVEVGSDSFVGLHRRVNLTHVRPRWRWRGTEAGWILLTR